MVKLCGPGRRFILGSPLLFDTCYAAVLHEPRDCMWDLHRHRRLTRSRACNTKRDAENEEEDLCNVITPYLMWKDREGGSIPKTYPARSRYSTCEWRHGTGKLPDKV